MANPLTLQKPPAGGGGDGPMKPGDVRIINAPDKSGNIVKTLVITRTDRPYVDDLCDAYNDARPQSLIDRGGKYYVTASGELKLGEDPEWTARRTADLEFQHEIERQRWLANHKG